MSKVLQNASREHSAILLTFIKLLYVFMFCLFLSGRLIKVLLYLNRMMKRRQIVGSICWILIVCRSSTQSTRTSKKFGILQIVTVMYHLDIFIVSKINTCMQQVMNFGTIGPGALIIHKCI